MANEPKPAAAESVQIGECANMKKNLNNAGAFIKVDDAAASLQAYLDLPGTPAADDPTHIFGHVFGLNSLRTLLTNIDTYNEGVTAENLISGIRIYYGVSVRHDPDFPLNPQHRMYRDLIFMPVTLDGTDLYPIREHHIEDIDLILSGSRPCPTQCPKFLDKIK